MINSSTKEKNLAWLASHPNAHILSIDDANYPPLLKCIPDAPPSLYVLGDVTCLQEPQLAMVGSRQCSISGKQQAESFAKHFARLGITITSGLAIGIDGASHVGALAAPQGKTIAVLAHGMDQLYPTRHKTLAAQIIQRGCLVSEFPLGVIPLPQNFPKRNRLISGLSLGVLVVEADLNSGSLITAKYALDQGRDVFAIPGAINLPQRRGCHRLIKQGAKLVESVEDVLEELPNLLNGVIRDKYAHTIQDCSHRTDLNEQQQQLLEFIDYDSTYVETLVESTGLASNVVGAILLELELQGVITAVPGGYALKSD